MPLGKPLSKPEDVHFLMLLCRYIAIYSFTLGKLCTDYEKLIKYILISDTVNKTLFKGEFLDYYKQYGIQEHIDRRLVVLVIPKGVKSIMQNVCFPSLYTLEATQMAGVAE